MDKLSILIIDDEPLLRQLLIQKIDWEKTGIGQIYEAYSIASALEVLESKHIDVALIDIEMSDGTGIEVLRWIHENIHHVNRCAFLTCHASFQYAQEALRLGCTDYLLKPVNYLEVESLIQKMVDEVRNAREGEEIARYGKRWILEKEQESKKLEKSPAKTEEILEMAKQYIDLHFTETCQLADVAKAVALNQGYLNRIFRKKYGITIYQYILDCRMKLAAKLILEGNTKFYAIADLVGYDNYSNFLAVFKKTYGVLPNEYKDSVNKTNE